MGSGAVESLHRPFELGWPFSYVYEMAGGRVVIDQRKLEVLKVWYAVFTTVMDAPEFNDTTKLAKLKQLRQLLQDVVPDDTQMPQ